MMNQKAREESHHCFTPECVPITVLDFHCCLCAWLFLFLGSIHIQFSAIVRNRLSLFPIPFERYSKFYSFHLKLWKLKTLPDISHIRWGRNALKYRLVMSFFPPCCFTVVHAHAMICEDSGYTSRCFLLLDCYADFPKQPFCLPNPFIYSAWIWAPLGMLFF